MSDTTIPATTAAAATNPNTVPTKIAPKASGLTSDFETFLKMLTAQARYQDPLEPIDSTEYAAQLAQFSMVEQQVQTNDTLADLFGQMGTSNMASLAGWVGMEARADSPMHFDGAPITISPNPAKTADQAFLVVKNSSGEEVQRVSIPVEAEPIEWAGVGSDGAPLASGIYAFSVESRSNGETITSGPTEVYGRITEAQFRDNEIMLMFDGGQTIPASSVSALREPS